MYIQNSAARNIIRCICFIVLVFFVCITLAASERAAYSSVFFKETPPENIYRNLPLYFMENKGQLDKAIKYYLTRPSQSIYFTDQSVHIRFNGESMAYGLKVEFIDTDPDVKVESIKSLPGMVNIFKGERENWRTNIPLSEVIEYAEPWPGISIQYKGKNGQLESFFEAAPGADISLIRLRYTGQEKLCLDEKGNLVIETPLGKIIESAPILYQEINGEKISVKGSFSIQGDIVGFQVDSYDERTPLIIDPTIIYAGYVGGNSNDEGNAVAVDEFGNVYITGTTYSNEVTFPFVVGPDTTFNGGSYDAFVVKVSADGTGLVYAGYIGGSNYDIGKSIAVDSDGYAYIAGTTYSNESSFPVTVGPDTTFNGGSYDAFVVKVSADGTGLVYAGYIGGSNYDTGNSIAVDSDGYAYIVGDTYSDEVTFPVTVGPDTTFNDWTDAFVAKVKSDGTGLVYAGYIGGRSYDYGNGIAVDGDGNAYITGYTFSSESQGFPQTVGPDLTFNGLNDAFVAKVKSDGTGLVYAGYIGGSNYDIGKSIAVDNYRYAYITGETYSDEVTFPVTVGPDTAFNGGSNDAFVAKVKSDGTGLVYAGYIGGNNNDTGKSIAVDANGGVYVTGETKSDEETFPVAVGPDTTFNGGSSDAFVAKVSTSGSRLVYSGYIGGSSYDYGNGMAVDEDGNAYIAGTTNSHEDTFPVDVGPDLVFKGDRDAFIVKISSYYEPTPVYRFWSNEYMHHFYTIFENEKDFVISNWPDVWAYEGPVFSAYSTEVPDTLPVYRFWSTELRGHFYTISEQEKDLVISTWPETWTYEGPVFYAYISQVSGTLPVYRFWSSEYQGHFYTISEQEKDFVIATWPDTWTFEGTAFYAYP